MSTSGDFKVVHDGQRAGELKSEALRERQSTITPKRAGVVARQTEAIGLDKIESHPALLQLARILGRSAARANMRRTRRGSAPVMATAEALLLIAVMALSALLWSAIVAQG